MTGPKVKGPGKGGAGIPRTPGKRWESNSLNPPDQTRRAELEARKKRIAAQRAANRFKIEECKRLGVNPHGSCARGFSGA